jgi:hypothetical protein
MKHRTVPLIVVLFIVSISMLGFVGAFPSHPSATTTATVISEAALSRMASRIMAGNKISDETRDFLNDNNDDEDDDDDDMPAGATRIFHIPTKSIKPGGLRLFLCFYLMGMQNTPAPKTWRAHQPTTTITTDDEHVVDFYYHDQTASLSLVLSAKHGVIVERYGSRPSAAYLMQENVIVQGILDELTTMIADENVKEENRLLTLLDPMAIEQARDTLAFG